MRERDKTTFIRVREMNKAVWEYIKIVAESTDKTIPAFMTDLVELHAKTTGKTQLLLTLLEEYGSLSPDTPEIRTKMQSGNQS